MHPPNGGCILILIKMKKLFAIITFFLFCGNSIAQSWQTLGLGVTGGTVGNPTVNAISYVGGKITIGGFFTKSGTTILNGVGQWNGNQWLPMETGLFHAILPAGNSGIGFEYFEYKNMTYLAGAFTTAGGTSGTDSTHSAKNIAKWDGVEWKPIKRWGDGFYGGAGSMIEYNNNLIIGGGFSGCSDSTFYLPTTSIAKWNDTVFSTIGSLYSNHPSGNDYVQDICIYNNKLIVGGYFNSINGSPYGSYGYIATYNDTIWDTLGSGFNAPVWALAVFNGELYAGGFFTATGAGVSVNRVAKWSGSEWLPVGEGLNDTVMRFCIDPLQNKLYAGGAFTQTGFGQPAKHIAEWNGTNWVEIGGGTNGFVYGMFAKDSNLYIGGGFTQVGSTPANHIAVWGNNPVGINEIQKNKKETKVFPNPNNGNFTFEYELKNNESGTMNIIDITGKLVASYPLVNTKNSLQINAKDLNNGVYLYHVVVNGKTINTDKLVIIKD